MSDFYKRFLTEDLRSTGASSGRVLFLGAFGKHPGWDDHIEDIGLESEGLIAAKRLLYVQGIGGQIDSGAWEKIDPAYQLAAFKHLFLWIRGGQFLLGRLWSSSDGKGRTRYPMIVAAHAAGARLTWSAEAIFPRLEEIESACALARSASEVRQTLDRARSELRSEFERSPVDTQPPFRTADLLACFVDHPALGPQREGWLRILYQMQSQMAAFAPGRFNARADAGSLTPQQIRVPATGDTPIQTLLLWARFFLSQFDPNVPLLLTLPLQETWVDATVGEPGSQEFFGLRASPKALPLASDVPYNLDPEIRRQLRERLDAFQFNAAADTWENDRAMRSGDTDSTARRLFRWFTGRSPSIL